VIRSIRVDHTDFFKWLLKLIHSLCTKRHEAAVLGLIIRSSARPIAIPCEDIQLALECQDVDNRANDANSPLGVQKHEFFPEDVVDLPLTTILEMLPETIGEDKEQLYHELGLIIQTLARRQMQPLDDLIRQSATMLKQRTEFYKHRQLLDMLSSYAIAPRPAIVHHRRLDDKYAC
jgi:hypothetical protein